ncbi:penicillin-binding protein [Vibrio breoganii]|uniref:penicillin-binding protein activator n=1 Tax=Vibrio breoganii TaxID=553239 RepID=UPI000C8672D9|nr:penicillin-binding protein activator [Vibrio breoganii]PMG08173.1 penicillin-binding protein [Vibrio breoganii]
MAQKNRSGYSVSRILTPIALSVLLAACSSPSSDPEAAQQSNILNQPTQTSEYYLIKADSSDGSEQIDWLILSLKAAVEEDNAGLANRIIQRLAQQNMSETQQAEWQLARAQLLLNEEQPTDALKQLNFRNEWRLERTQWQRYYELRSEIYQDLYQPLDAAREQVLRADFLSEEQQQENVDQIWALMNSVTVDELKAMQIAENEHELKGWQELAIANQSYSHNLPKLQKSLQAWIDENFSHPASLYTPQEIKDILALEIVQPNKTALVLPLSGKFAKQAEVIRDGFVFAMMSDEARLPEAEYVVIDSNKNDTAQIQQQLEEQNVDFVVGPLMRNTIEELQDIQQDSDNPIPMLALNFPKEILEGSDFCYVTLSPEQEAAEAARHLADTGAKYPLIIAPRGSYGQRMADAFNEEWNKNNETKSAVSYFRSKNQLQFAINTVFGLQDSQKRIAQMDKLMGMEMESEQRSRRDIDAVYIIAGDSELNLIKPFINVAINPEATPPKLYANSRSNTGVKRASQDLSGVIYSDIPMLVEPNEELDTQMQGIWEKSSNQQKRLRALGMDAYSLINALPNMKVSPGHSLQGQTGVLSIDEQCVVQRQLSWAEYESTK